ncbi:YgaP family membrane protein [Halomarina pelagica]|uniref:YgaP family membrane protein n=1 Tax=Halomarina pelagica TaxID=2961599 RepID=UPI0020C26A93|nr:DUF2892 domain-containing protein [Halomarina sp. BND7]
MQKNVGGYDRIARLVLGPILVAVALAGLFGVVGLAIGPVSTLIVAVIAGLVGVVFLVTGTTQKCPLNRALGVDTYRGDASERDSETPPAGRTT